jgi:hypothetical protein
MTSEARSAANRRNARYSTGPRTEAGKAASSRNATRHGLLARDTCLPDEDSAQFQHLRQRVFDDLEPEGILEETCCERIADAIWRLRRTGRLEYEIFIFETSGAQRESEGLAAQVQVIEQVLLSGLTPEERQLLTARTQESMAEEERRLVESRLGVAFIRDANGANALGKLSRYEAAIQRTLFRNLDELKKLQSERRCEDTTSKGGEK